MNTQAENHLLLVNNKSAETANICFVNSTIQLIKKTAFVQFIFSNKNNLPDDAAVCHALYDLLSGNPYKEKSAEVIRNLVAKKAKREYFNNQTQQDAEEFVRSLVDVICEELQTIGEFEEVKDKHFGEERISKVFLDNLPFGSCKRCNQLPSCRNESFLFLKLIVPSSRKKIDLNELIKSHYSALSDVLWMKCSNCCLHERCPQTGFCNRKAAGKTEVSKFPQYLLVSLLRFGESLQGTKVNTEVEFGDRVAFPAGNIYTPISSICHTGTSLNSGHYVTYAKTLQGYWWLHNDAKLSRVGFEQIRKADTYIILLQKEEANEIKITNTVVSSNIIATEQATVRNFDCNVDSNQMIQKDQSNEGLNDNMTIKRHVQKNLNQ